MSELGIPSFPVWFEPWRERVACRPDRDWFVAENNLPAIEELKAICSACPVRVKCLEAELAHTDTDSPVGVFGGLTPKERKELRKQRQVPVPSPTPSGNKQRGR